MPIFKAHHLSKMVLHAWTLEIKLKMHPFRYLNNDAVVTLTGNGTVNNPGTVYSEPVITIEGNGDVSLTIGKQTIQLTIDTKATIDCRHKNKMSMTKMEI